MATTRDSALSEGLAIEHSSTAERVALALREMILGGKLLPGTPLREEVLATSSKVSRNTVRAAIHILVHEGLVTHQHHRVAVVAEIDEDDVADIYRIRLILELAGVDAAATAGPEQLQRLSAEMRAFAEAAEARAARAIVEHDLGFHRCVVALLRSRRCDQLFENIQGELLFCLSVMSAADREFDDPEPMLAEHQEIHDAILAGQHRRARDLLRRHLIANERRLREILVASRATSDGG